MTAYAMTTSHPSVLIFSNSNADAPLTIPYIKKKTTKEISSSIDAHIIMTLEFSAPNLNVNGKMIEYAPMIPKLIKPYIIPIITLWVTIVVTTNPIIKLAPNKIK